MTIASGDSVTIEYTGRLDDGSVFDTSHESVAAEEGLADQTERDYTPLTVEVGNGKVIEGLEEALLDMDEGDTEVVQIPPGKGYGERDEERVVEYDTAELREMLQGTEPAEGMRLQTEQGLPGEVVDVGQAVVRVDFNHELAGEHLEFEIKVVEVR